MTDELKDFCRNYEVNVLNDQKRRARYHPPRFFHRSQSSADIIRNDIVKFETEQVITLWKSPRVDCVALDRNGTSLL
jgi:hypothetical protein